MNLKHGDTKTKLYSVWKGMRRRCNNPKSHAYSYYGGRGITVCKDWDESFVAFKSWAIAAGYREGLTIERVNNEEGYSPSNCTWATRAEQVRNTRPNKSGSYPIYVNGKTLKELAAETGVKYSTLKERRRKGWSDEDIIFTQRGNNKTASCKPVRAIFSDESFKDYESQIAAEEDGYSNRGISHCIRGRQSIHRGAKWILL